MSERDIRFHQKLIDNFVAQTPHMHDAGMRVTEVGKAGGTMLMPARPTWMGDPVRGLMHPGPLTTLADSCCGLAVTIALPRFQPIATLDLRMDFLRVAGPERDVYCAANCFRLTPNVGFVDAEVWQDDRTQPIAIARGAFMISTPSGKRPGTVGAIAKPDKPHETAASAAAAPWSAPSDAVPQALDRPIPYADYLGVQVAFAHGQPLYRMPYRDQLIGNPFLPALHGGVIAGFSNTAAVLHLIHTLHGAKLPKTIDFSIDYLRSGRPEDTWASCEVVRIGSRVALVQIRCWQRGPDYPITVSRAHLLLTDPDDGEGNQIG